MIKETKHKAESKIDRILSLINYLSSNNNYRISDISSSMNVSLKSVYKYINILKKNGMKIIKKKSGIFKIIRFSKGSPDIDRLIYFSNEELQVINSLLNLLSPSNVLKIAIRQKIMSILNETAAPGIHTESSNIEALGDAISEKRVVILKNYYSVQTGTIENKKIEPFEFTTDFIDVWGYDIESGKNILFRSSVIGQVEVTDQFWENEKRHHKGKMDVFHNTGSVPHKIRLILDCFAKNIITEEYPLSRNYICLVKGQWIFETIVYDYSSLCRFYVGLAKHIKIIDSPQFEQYVIKYLRRNFKNLTEKL